MIILFVPGFFLAQDPPARDMNAKIKSLFIYGYTRYIRWSNEKNFKEFKIGLLGQDSALFSELNLTLGSKNFKNSGIKFEVVSFGSIDEIDKTRMIYVHQRTGYDLKDVLNKISGNNTLLISENYPFGSSMINFVLVDNNQKFELNEDLMIAEGLELTNQTLKARAIKSADEWQKLYRKKEAQLKIEQQKLEEQKQELKTTQEKVEVQKAEIADANLRIDKQRTEIRKQTLDLNVLMEANTVQQANLQKQLRVLDRQQTEMLEQERSIADQQGQMGEQQSRIDNQKNQMTEQEGKIDEQKKVLGAQMSQIKQQQVMLYMAIGFVVMMIAGGMVVYRSYQAQKRFNAQLAEKNEAINAQADQIERKNRSITSSIEYAKRIQQAILTSREYLDKILPHHFIYYRPRDIVSGDFFWAYETKDNKVIFAAVDCTGHGVPGAFMSMVGNAMLNEIVIENKVHEPAHILEDLRAGVIRSLKQTGDKDEAKDGMDIALVVWDKKASVARFAGAHNPFYLYRNKELTEIKGDSTSISYQIGRPREFTQHEVELQAGDSIYIFSDGFVDQKGGERKKKFFYKPFKALLAEMTKKPMSEQRAVLKQTFLDWKGDLEQMDDVCIIGVRV